MTSIDRLVRLFETLAPADVPRLALWYAQDARFTDPFNDVQGRDAIARVYAHMFEALDGPRFVVTARLGGGSEWMLLWEFRFRFRGRPRGEQVIVGASHLQLAPDGCIRVHRDYWDAAELYAKLPVLGRFMRWLRRRGAAR